MVGGSPSAAAAASTALARGVVGVALPVKVAPDNQNMVMFEWDRI